MNHNAHANWRRLDAVGIYSSLKKIKEWMALLKRPGDLFTKKYKRKYEINEGKNTEKIGYY